MFKSEVYARRREELQKKMKSGIALFMGNNEAPINYPGNTYHFRQDSDFLYYFGIDLPGLAGMIDFDSGKEWIFGNDFTMDDIVWTGPQPTIAELASGCGIKATAALSRLEELVAAAVSGKRRVHFLPPYRGETKMTIGALLRENPCQMKSHASGELIGAVVSMRSIKEKVEVQEIEKALEISHEMHLTAMKMCKKGVSEQDIFGIMEGLALKKGAGTAFPIILSINGQTLHNHSHGNILERGRMMVADAGAESKTHYSSDITRTTPVGGKFSSLQKDIYEIVLKANTESIASAGPGTSNLELHLNACRIIASGLTDLGLMRGNAAEAVSEGAHALFMPHGLGHMMGLDVHDMESLGEDNVGYNDEVRRSSQFGLAFLRFALPFKPGHVFTIEPGCYFIPELIAQWKGEKKHDSFINYSKIDKYMSVGGIRIEDDVLITEKGHKLLGKPVPKTVRDVEAACS